MRKTICRSTKNYFMVVVTAVACLAPLLGHATSGYLSAFNSRYGTSGTRLNSCSTCHDGSPPATNFYGDDFLNQLNLGRSTATALANIEPIDSDADGASNLMEIQARTFPGDPADKPATANPSLTVTPTALAFGALQQGQTKSLTVTLGNNGTANCNITALTRSGSADFAFGPDAPVAPFTITPGSSIAVPVAYTPSNVGADSGGLQISSNDPAHPMVTVALTGTGDPLPPSSAITVSPTTLSYGAVQVGQSKQLSVTIGNTGGASCSVTSLGLSGDEFAVGPGAPSTPFSVAPGASIAVTVTYAPTSAANGIGTLSIASTDPNNPVVNVSLSGSGVVPLIGATPGSMDFGAANIGTSVTRSIAVTNSGGAALSVTSVVLTASAEFDYGTSTPFPPFVIAVGRATNVTVVYQPADVGSDSGTLVIGSDAANAPALIVGLTAAGQAPVPVPQIQVTPASLAFGSVRLGETNTLKVLVNNTGGAVAHVGEPVLGGSAEFATAATGFDLAPGASNEVAVSYAPTGAGDDAGSLTIASDDPVNPLIVIGLSGKGGHPVFSATPASVSFGSVLTNGALKRIVTLANSGTMAGTVTGLTIAGSSDFSVDSSTPVAPFMVAAGASVDITLNYSPRDVGADAGTLNISSDDPANPTLAVPLSGAGTLQALDIDISNFQVDKKYEIGDDRARPIKIFATVVNRSRTNEARQLTVIGLQNGAEVYRRSMNAMPKPRGNGARITFPDYVPVAAGQIDWTATIEDNDPDADIATAVTLVTVLVVDLDITRFTVTPSYDMTSKRSRPIQLQLQIRSAGRTSAARTATVVGMQSGLQVYSATVNVGGRVSGKGSLLPTYVPTSRGTIQWTATVLDDDPDVDTARAITTVIGPSGDNDDDEDDDDDDDEDDSGEH